MNWGVLSFNLFLRLYLLMGASLLQAATAPPPPPPANTPKQTTPAPGNSHPATPQPSGGGSAPIPNSGITGNGSPSPVPPYQDPPPMRPQFGGGGGDEPKVVDPPTEFFIPKKHRVVKKVTRSPAFVTSGEVVYRSGPYFLPISTAEKAGLSDQSLTIDTVEKEAENDALISRYEYQNDLQVLNANRLLHAQVDALYKKGVIPQQEYDQSLSTVKKSEGKAEESKNRWAEYEAEMAISQLRLSQTQGKVVPLSEIAQAYAHLWEVRVAKAKAAVMEASADYDYTSAVYERYKALKASYPPSVTDSDLINYQKEASQSYIILSLAKEAVTQNTKFFGEASDHVATVEKFEAEAAVQNSGDTRM